MSDTLADLVWRANHRGVDLGGVMKPPGEQWCEITTCGHWRKFHDGAGEACGIASCLCTRFYLSPVDSGTPTPSPTEFNDGD